jgi:putative oxidoreductase
MNGSSSDAFGKLILRLTLGILILLHGIAKVAGHPASLDFIRGQLGAVGLPPELAYGVFVGEVLAPLMLILGIFSRIGGLLVALNMVFAIGLVHMSQLPILTDSGGWELELQGMFLFTAVAILFIGSGRVAIRPD